MDDPFDPTAKCCVVSLNSGGDADETTTVPSEARGRASFGLVFALFLLMVPHIVVQ
jgi:hypothetical protein